MASQWSQAGVGSDLIKDVQESLKSSATPAKRTVRLTPEGWVFVVVLLFVTFGATLRNVNLLVVLAGMMFCTLILNWRFALKITDALEARRILPRQIHAGGLTNVVWRIDNRSEIHTMWTINIDDRVDDVSEGRSLEYGEPVHGWLRRSLEHMSDMIHRRRRANTNQVRASVPRINPASQEPVVYRMMLHRRGAYEFGPASISTNYPFGLIQIEIDVADRVAFYAAPPVGRLNSDWEKQAAAMVMGTESSVRKRGVEDDEFFALRQWRPGDSKKNIHWRSTAKMQTPMVKQHDQPSQRDLAIVIDLYNEPSDPNNASLLDDVLSFAATVVVQPQQDAEGKVAVAICGQEIGNFPNVRNRETNLNCLQCLATAIPGTAPDIFTAIQMVKHSVARGTPILVVSARPKPDWLNQMTTDVAAQNADSGAESRADGGTAATAERAAGERLRWLHAESEDFRALFTPLRVQDNHPIGQLIERLTVS